MMIERTQNGHLPTCAWLCRDGSHTFVSTVWNISIVQVGRLTTNLAHFCNDFLVVASGTNISIKALYRLCVVRIAYFLSYAILILIYLCIIASVSSSNVVIGTWSYRARIYDETVCSVSTYNRCWLCTWTYWCVNKCTLKSNIWLFILSLSLIPGLQKKIRRTELHRYIYEYRLPIGYYIYRSRCVELCLRRCGHSLCTLELNSSEDQKMYIIQTSCNGLHL